MIGNILHHVNASVFQIPFSKEIYHGHNDTEHNGYNAHDDHNKLIAEFSGHDQSTSKWYPILRMVSIRMLDPMLESFFRRNPT